MTGVLQTAGSVALDDLLGYVHGVKGKNPWVVQCDDCLTCFSGDWLLGVAKSAVFNNREGSKDRLCYPCWEKRGWVDTYQGWEKR